MCHYDIWIESNEVCLFNGSQKIEDGSLHIRKDRLHMFIRDMVDMILNFFTRLPALLGIYLVCDDFYLGSQCA